MYSDLRFFIKSVEKVDDNFVTNTLTTIIPGESIKIENLQTQAKETAFSSEANLEAEQEDA